MDYQGYLNIIKAINEAFGTSVHVEHQCIHEFFDGDRPIFKLLFSKLPTGGSPVVIVSFHLEMEITEAIQWFLRLRQVDPSMHITGCYLKDSEGVSHVGEDAEILRMYTIQQEVISEWMKSDKDAEDVKNALKPAPATPTPTFSNVHEAVMEFNKMNKKKGDTFH